MSLSRIFHNSLFPLERNLFRPLQSSLHRSPLNWDMHFDDAPSPRMEVINQDKETIVQAELPGFKKEDINVEISDDGRMLTISGQTKRDQTYKEEDVTYTERSYGTFSRSVSLPFNSDRENIKASYEDGVLKVMVPKNEQAQHQRTITIE